MFKIPVLGLNLSPRDQPSLSEASAGDRAHAVGPRCLDDAWSVELDFREGQQLGELIFQESQVGKDQNLILSGHQTWQWKILHL